MLRQSTTNAGDAVLQAAKYNQTEVVAALLAQNAETTWQYYQSKTTALHFAAKHNNAPMIINLRQHNANETVKAKVVENEDEDTPIAIAASLRNWQAVIAFTVPVNGRTKIADLATQSGHALLFAALFNETSVVKTLLANKVPTHWWRGDTGNGPLHLAVVNANIEMIMDLRRSGASETALNKKNQTPIQLATEIATQKNTKESWDVVKAFAQPLHEIHPIVKSIPVALDSDTDSTILVAKALSGNEIAITALAKHYRDKSDHGKALLFTALDISAVGCLEADNMKGLDYINSIKSSISLWFKDASLSSLCELLLAGLAKPAGLMQRDRDAYQLGNDPIKLLLLTAAKTESSAKLDKVKIKMQESLIAVLNDMGMDSETAKEYLKSKQKSIAMLLNPSLSTSVVIEALDSTSHNVQEKIIAAPFNDAEHGNAITYTDGELLKRNGSFSQKAQLSVDTNQPVNTDTDTNSPAIF